MTDVGTCYAGAGDAPVGCVTFYKRDKSAVVVRLLPEQMAALRDQLAAYRSGPGPVAHNHAAASVPPSELGLLESYRNGPRVWDATAIVPIVFALDAKGLIEPVSGDDHGGAYRLTGAGRRELKARGRA
jgi:hypothetical protein